MPDRIFTSAPSRSSDPAPNPTPPPVTREERGAATRERILSSAAEVFAEAGFAGATLRAVAERAGVKQPLLLYHFGSKDALWQAGVERLFGRVIDAASAALGEGGPSSLRPVLRSFLEVAAREPAWLRILVAEGGQAGPRLDWLVEHHTRHTFGAAHDWLDRVERSPALPPGVSVAHQVYLLVGAATFVLSMAPEFERVTGEDALTPEFLDRHADLLVRLFFPSDPSAKLAPEADK